MPEIEDLGDEASVRPPREDGTVRHRIKKVGKAILPDLNGDHHSDSIIPEKIMIFVQTWGCSHNTSDSEYMAGILQQYGYRVTLGGAQDHAAAATTSEKENTDEACCNGEKDANCCRTTIKAASDYDADLYLFNSCTVKGPAEDHFRNAVVEAKRRGKHVVVAGCVPQGQKALEYLKNTSMIGVQQIDRVLEVVDETLNGNVVQFLEKRVEGRKRLAGAPLDLPKIRRNPLIEVLAISTGCLNACTYCKTKHARGVLASYPIDELIERAEQAFVDGVKEIWLTSEDLGAYGRDLIRDLSDPVELECSRWYYKAGAAKEPLENRFPNFLTLVDLLARLVQVIPEGCMLRLGMTNPPYILDQLEEMAYILKHPRVYAFLHIPVQSGSNKVLDAMKREYTVEDFCRVVDQTKAALAMVGDDLTIATDLICGFPTETDEDFEETFNLCKRFQFPTLFINQFFARPGTPAANMKRVASTAQVKNRTAKVNELFKSYRPYEKLLNTQQRVLITESSTDSRFWVGHTRAYQQVLVEKVPQLLGTMVEVKIVECQKFYMRGDLSSKSDLKHLMKSDRQYKKRLADYSISIRSRKTQVDLYSVIPILAIGLVATWIYMRFVCN